MPIDLLFRGEDTKGVTGERLLYHLSFDLYFSHIFRDSTKRAYFLDIISSPLTSKDAILSRQQILRDFISHPGLLSAMMNLALQFDAIRTSWNEYRHERYRNKPGSKKSPTAAAQEQCSVSAMTLGKLLYFIRDLKELLERFRPESWVFRELLSEVRSIVSGDPFDGLIAVCGELEHRTRSTPIDLRITLNELGRISSAELIDHKYVFITDRDIRQKRSWLKKQVPEGYPCEHVTPTQEEWDELLPTPFRELANVIDDVVKQIFERYSGMSRELVFYEAAVAYAAFLTEKAVPFTFPEFTGDGTVNIENLYDIGLLVLSGDTADIVPHTSRTRSGSIVVCGDNGSGKTSFLRSLTTAQLMAQAGLPIPAETAVLNIYRAIITQFAEAEKEFEAGNDAGRFEQEVREIAALIDQAPPNSLAVLNETFQTTAYDEGAEGLYHILRYFTRKGISYVIATHMNQLRDKLDGDAMFIRVNGSHELEYDEEKH